MNANARVGMMAFVGVVVTAAFAGPAAAGSNETNATDVNPVFAPMRELPRAALDRSNGKGVGDLQQNASLIVNGTEIADGTEPGEESSALQSLQSLPSGTFTGNNSIAASAFSDSQVFAAIVQNNGSYVNIQNLMAVEVNMLP